MGIHLHFKLTEYIYFKNYFSSSNWDDILLRHCHQIILLKPMRTEKLGLLPNNKPEICQLCWQCISQMQKDY